jgi:CysZ protein
MASFMCSLLGGASGGGTQGPVPARRFPRFGGAGYLLSGFALLRAPALRRYVLWPIGIGAALWLLAAAVLLERAGTLVRSIAARLPDWLDPLALLVWPLLVIALGLAFAYGFALVVALLAAPFYSALARHAETLLDPAAPSPPEVPLVRDALRTVGGELRKLGYFVVVGTPLLISLWIPGLNLLTGPLWLVWGAWLIALEYLDFPAGNHGHDFRAVRALARRTPLRALGFGTATLLALSVPLLNLVAMPAAVAGAAAWWTDLRQRGAVGAVP